MTDFDDIFGSLARFGGQDAKLQELVTAEGASDWSRKAALLGTGRTTDAVNKHFCLNLKNDVIHSAYK